MIKSVSTIRSPQHTAPSRRRHPLATLSHISKEADVCRYFARWPVPTIDQCDIVWVTIDVLPDVALLEIFDFFVDEASRIEAWCTLVRVCRKWRNVTFGSPRRLNLRLCCKARTPVMETLDVWPLLPIIIRVHGCEMLGVDNIIAALEHNDRICQIELIDIPSSQMEKVLSTMQQPFPGLTRLELLPSDGTAPVVPSSFLGVSSPCLQTLILDCIPFPRLSKLLLSTTYLVRLNLYRIPHSGYISPEVMASCLSVLTRLDNFVISFESPQRRPDWNSRSLPPRTRALLPVLTLFLFKGVTEYFEDLVARIDAPLLDKLTITFFNQLIYDTPQTIQFIRRTPTLKASDEARVAFSDTRVWVTFPQKSDGALELGIACSQSDWQLSALAQVCRSSFPQALIPVVEHLYILEDKSSRPRWQDDIENNQWLELLRLFTSVRSLYISQEFLPRISPAIQELIGEGPTEVLPALRSLFLEKPLLSGPVQETIGQFVAARQLVGHPITILRWNTPWTLHTADVQVERDILIDGYTAHTFGPHDAEAYFVSLLKRESGQIQWHTDVTGAVLVTPPPGWGASDQHVWVMDHIVRETGPVIQQKLWAPKKTSGKMRRVDHVQLFPPIFFTHNNGQDLGLHLVDAARGNCMCLRGAEKAARVGPSAHAQIRINVSTVSTFILHGMDLMVRISPSQWRGYEHLNWNEQISIQKQTRGREAVSLESFAKQVGRKVLKFMEVILIRCTKHSLGN